LERHLHIISLNVPYPVDYGGVYDLFYKLPALHEQGVKIHLHCFTKERKEQPELNKHCEEVFYYQRNTGHKGLSSKLPYIVASRNSEELTKRLLQDEYPILMEGVHCTYITNDERFKNRKLFVRMHNVENEYYKQLYQFSSDIKKSTYYWLEAKRLYTYEKKLTQQAIAFWAVAKQDMDYYEREFKCVHTEYLPLFIPAWKMNAQEGMGTNCLYHGNLEIEENEYAATWLLKNVFKKIEIPFVIAGKNPSKKISSLVKRYKHVSLIANPDEKKMNEIISNAHIHVLPSFNSTGIKIKLLNALYNGKHCVANDAMVTGTALRELCHVVNDAGEFIERIQLLYHQPFTLDEKNFRKRILKAEFSNTENAKKIVEWVFKPQVD
jgi:hypothetical protein